VAEPAVGDRDYPGQLTLDEESELDRVEAPRALGILLRSLVPSRRHRDQQADEHERREQDVDGEHQPEKIIIN